MELMSKCRFLHQLGNTAGLNKAYTMCTCTLDIIRRASRQHFTEQKGVTTSERLKIPLLKPATILHRSVKESTDAWHLSSFIFSLRRRLPFWRSHFLKKSFARSFAENHVACTIVRLILRVESIALMTSQILHSASQGMHECQGIILREIYQRLVRVFLTKKNCD